MTLDEVRRQLQELTNARRKGVDSELISDLRAATGKPPKMTEEELRQKEKALEAQLPGWWVVWEQVNSSYGVIPSE